MIALLLAGLLVGICSITNHVATHLGEGPKRVFSLPGTAPLTEQQGLDFATQTLKLDGRYRADLEPMDYGVPGRPQYLNRPSPADLTGSVAWLSRSRGTEWYVFVERKKDRVACWSFPSK